MKVAVLDLNDNVANQGIKCIRDLLGEYGVAHGLDLSYEIFDVRHREEVPSTDFDAYISSGGPGSPLETEGMAWEAKYFNLIDKLMAHNASTAENKKHVFFICHSFQLFCRQYGLGNVCKRRRYSFGVYPIHKTEAGRKERFLKDLPDPYYGADFRAFQVIEPNAERMEEMGATLLSIEKERPHVDLERAMMAMRFTKEFFGTQFHPEADAEGMAMYFQVEEKKKQVIEAHGLEKYESMVEQLLDPTKIVLTQACILPSFLDEALGVLV